MDLEPLEAPIGERVLWRGQSDPHHLRRGSLRDAATSLLGQAGTVAVILVIIAGTGSDVLFFAPWIIGFIIVFGRPGSVDSCWRLASPRWRCSGFARRAKRR